MAKTDSRMPSRASERKASAAILKAGKAARELAATQSDADSVTGIKARAAKAAAAVAPESLGRCTTAGEPTGAKHNLAPRPDSVRDNNDGTGRMGTCPKCGTFAKLHGTRGVMLMHVMRGETLPASPALSEPNIEPTDTGARTGDPLAGSKRRGDDIDGAWERGTVSIRVKDDRTGMLLREDVPATLDNLREALRQEKGRKLRKPESIAASQALMASLRRKIKAAEAGKGAMDAPSAAQTTTGTSVNGAGVTVGQRGEARLDGVAMVQGRDEGTLTHEQWQARQAVGGFKADAGTLWGPIGRERPDATITEEPMSGGRYGYLTEAEYEARSETQKRRYRERVAKRAERAERSRSRMAARRPVRLGTGGSRSAGSLVGDSASMPDREHVAVERVMGQAPGGTSERMERIAARS